MTSAPAVWHCIFLYVGRATSAVRVTGVYGLTRVLLHGAAFQEMLFDRRELQALTALSEPARLVNTVHGRTRNTVYPTACSDGHTRTTPTQLILYGIATTRPHLRCHCYRTRALDRGTAHLPSGCPSGHPVASQQAARRKAPSGLQPRRRLSQPPVQLARAPRSRGLRVR